MKDINCMGGCSSKLDNNRLTKILKLASTNLIGNEDSSIWNLENGKSLIESLDFFPQISDSLYTYGQITACNSISDIYAMGGKPEFALSILTVTKDMSDEDIALIIKGMKSILDPLKIKILGGHTIITNDLLCGLSVTGFVDNIDLKLNNTPKVGDILVISKPLGFGTIMAAKSIDMVNSNDYEEAIRWMTTPNELASLQSIKYNFNSLTDVTGFGLAGHLLEKLNNKFTASIQFESIPLIKNVLDYLGNYIVNGALANNRRNYSKDIYFDEDTPFAMRQIFFDPQTSGGLLGTLSEKEYLKLIQDPKNVFTKIGVIKEKSNYLIKVEI